MVGLEFGGLRFTCVGFDVSVCSMFTSLKLQMVDNDGIDRPPEPSSFVH